MVWYRKLSTTPWRLPPAYENTTHGHNSLFWLIQVKSSGAFNDNERKRAALLPVNSWLCDSDAMAYLQLEIVHNVVR